MAQRTYVVMVDDLDATDIPQGAGQTVRFGLDGISYEIDLTTENAEALRSTLQPYVDNGRRVRGRKPTDVATGRRAVTQDYDPAAVKAWAASHKIDVPTRGRIPKAVVDQFKAAGN